VVFQGGITCFSKLTLGKPENPRRPTEQPSAALPLEIRPKTGRPSERFNGELFERVV
jgi:hypothetical protein